MKKETSFFYIAAAILLLTVSGCKLKVEDSELANQPEASALNDITIVIPQLNNDTDYINLYRMDTHDGEVLNIGMLYHPNSLLDKNYFFTDTLVFKNHKYKYRARYHDSTGYHYTEWSNEVKAEADTFLDESNHSIEYDVSGANFSYSNTAYTITISGDITPPDFPGWNVDEYTPMLIVSNSRTTQLFKLDSIEDGAIINLRNLLPFDFQDTDITIKGILAQKQVYKNNKEEDGVRFTVWTPASDIKISGARNNTMNIPSQRGQTGLDYSRNIR